MGNEVVGDSAEVPERLFSPVKKNYLWMFSTSIYFVLLSIAYLFLKSYLPHRIESLSFVYFHFFNISSAILLLIIGVSISISIFTYKSFPKALAFFGVFFGAYLYLYLFFFMEVLIYIFVGLLVTLVLGVLLRGFIRIKTRWIKIFLVLIPFLVIFMIIFITSLQGQSYTLEDCADLDFGLQWGCYMKFAIQDNNISICSGHSYDGDCIEKVIASSNGSYSYAGECDTFERKDVCYLTVAKGIKDFTLCEKLSNSNLRDSCKHPIMWYTLYALSDFGDLFWDLADLKVKSADVEAWSPRRREYFEVGSCSNLTDAQARRLGIRVQKGSEHYFSHTLNNTVVASPRALIAVLENFYCEDGSVRVPEVLVGYMGGLRSIASRK